MRMSDGSSPGVSQLLMSESAIELVCGPSMTAASTRELALELCVQMGDSSTRGGNDAGNQPDWLSLMVERDPEVTAIAQIGIQSPKYVVDAFTPFAL